METQDTSGAAAGAAGAVTNDGATVTQTDQKGTDSAGDKTPDTGKADAGKKETKVKARVLVDSHFGKVNDVVLVTKDEAKDAEGVVDTAKAAVAYAESLVADKQG